MPRVDPTRTGPQRGRAPRRTPRRPGAPQFASASRAATLSLCLFGLALVGLSGCATSGASEEETAEPSAERARVAAVRIQNEQPSSFAVHLVTNADTYRLGLVTGHNTATFEITAAMLGGAGSVQFVADPVGSAALYRSAEVQLRAGDLAEWDLRGTPGISRATITVRRGVLQEVEGEEAEGEEEGAGRDTSSVGGASRSQPPGGVTPAS